MITILILFLVGVYWYGTRRHGYWRQKNVTHEKPVPFFGTDTKAFLLLKSLSQTASETYWKFPEERFVGTYRGQVPQLVIRDPDLIRDIMITDFSSFYSRGLHPCEDSIEPLLRNLFFADGDLWRMLRQRLTPAFTSGKLRAMCPLILDLAEKLQIRVSRAATSTGELDAHDLMARYTTDFIGSCGFGVETDCLNDDKSSFKKLGVKIYKITFWRSIAVILKCIFPRAFKSLKFLGQDVEDDLTSLVKFIRKQRNDEPSSRRDFVDLMIELTHKAKLSVESIEAPNVAGSPNTVDFQMDDKLVTAQCFIFFAAGFETSTTATSFTLHQLAHHPDVQIKAQEQIDEILKKYGGKQSYEAIKEMTYLEWTLMEGLRMFPPGLLIRKCTRRYTLPNTSVTIDRGVKIIIPLEALHSDPQYFDDPDQFVPERFSPENVAKRHKHVYIPFGAGPRFCIGLGPAAPQVSPLPSQSSKGVTLAYDTLRLQSTQAVSRGGVALAINIDIVNAFNTLPWGTIREAMVFHRVPPYLQRIVGAYLLKRNFDPRRARLGVLQALAGLAAVLARYSVRPAPRCPRRLRAHPASTLVQNIHGAVPLIFCKRR